MNSKDLILIIPINKYTDLVSKIFNMIIETLIRLCPLVSNSYKVID